jgi:uncharacterized caspase-like protein
LPQSVSFTGMKTGSRPFLLLCSLLIFALQAPAATHRRALLVGVDDYSASHLAPAAKFVPVPGRDYPNLAGAVNDVRDMAEMLVHLYGVERADIVTLTDQQATRDAILQAIETHLLKPAAKGDVLLFYFSGHGSQVVNSRSAEADKLDESIVPADSRTGALDIRDKELSVRFNQILDRGARLTVILDSCHSGSGARGLPTGMRPRGVKLDPRDVADDTDEGRAPEERGALVVSAAEDYEIAWEASDEWGRLHGAFSLAWMHALRKASSGEPAIQTFLRAQARLRGKTPYQEPVLAGNAQARFSPFLGTRIDRRGDHTVVAVEKIRDDGTVVLQGGWANGLTAGCELRPLGGGEARLTVTAVRGLATSEAVPNQRRTPQSLQLGALLEVVGWAVPPGAPLRVSMPRAPISAEALRALARSLASAAKEHNVHWIADPLNATPMRLLRWQDDGWELLDGDGRMERLGDPMAAIGKIAAGSSLFVQFPAPAAMLDRIGVHAAVETVKHPEQAEYVLVGRYAERKLQYAWVRPTVKASDLRKTSLPLRTSWSNLERGNQGIADSAAALGDLVVRLRRIHDWNQLESPQSMALPYRLAILRARDGEEIHNGALIGGEKYGIVLRGTPPLPAQIEQRFIYVFTIDSFGRSVLLFPRDHGTVENRFPLPPAAGQSAPYPPVTIPLGPPELFEASPPFGIDTYFLLSTDLPLPDPWIVESDGVLVRTPTTPLEKLLLANGRGSNVVTYENWSIERLVCESVPRRAATGGSR